MAELLQIRNCADPRRCGDVIFVHGLNGNPRDYWFPAGEPEKYWPAWLGEDLPKVGIWSLGYENAALKPRRLSLARRFLQAGFSMPLVDRADDVLLRLELEGIGERPLVFIGHSMGGLLVKQVLHTANDSIDVKKRAILERTRGVCFIATPHIGSDLAKWAHYFGSLLGINFPVEELRPHEPHLRKLNQWYRDFVTREGNSIKTLSFYEMKPLPRVGLVVEAGDADPGVPHAGLHPLDEDHNSICKPTSKSSSIYQKTMRFVSMDCLRSFPSSTWAGSESPEESRTSADPRASHAPGCPGGMPRVSPPVSTEGETPAGVIKPDSTPRAALAFSDGPVSLGSPYYVERDADRHVFAHLAAPGSTVTVKGHGKSGKTSLLLRLRSWARDRGYDSCRVDFHGFDATMLSESATLFRRLAQVLVDQLDLDVDPAVDWSANRPDTTNLSRFVERRVLGRSGHPILLLFDDADLVFPHRRPCEELFSVLRFWHNERANDLEGRGWGRLGLVIAHATNPALWIRNLNQSPFNVGLRVLLDDFDAAQVGRLNELHGRPLHTPAEVGRLVDLVGGHPYLVRIALHEMAVRHRSLEDLERMATRQDGPFASPLRFLTDLVQNDEPLRNALRSILVGKTCDDESLFQRLWAVGLVQGENRGHVEFRARVYEDFFRKIL